MNFFLYTFIEICLTLCVDIAKFVSSNAETDLPPDPEIQKWFKRVSMAAVVGEYVVPIYAFFILPWWQVILGWVIGLCFVQTCRTRLRNSPILYKWSMGFGATAIIGFVYALNTPPIII